MRVVKVIGLGGVGSIVARYLTVFLAGRGIEQSRVVLVDGDKFELKNATRMLFSSLGNKAEVVLGDLQASLLSTSLTLEAVGEYIHPKNVKKLIREEDIVLLCVDNHATRKLVSEHCGTLKNVTLISGGNDGVSGDQRGTYGNVQAYLRKDGEDVTPSLTEYHPEIREPADKLPSDLSCVELLESTPQILFANLAVASAILNAFMLTLTGKLSYGEACFDIQDALTRPIPWPTKLEV